MENGAAEEINSRIAGDRSKPKPKKKPIHHNHPYHMKRNGKKKKKGEEKEKGPGGERRSSGVKEEIKWREVGDRAPISTLRKPREGWCGR
ncbi:hypothetical protein LWI28_007318 [Acer negundo]|uniref:Uncharacterized protein n=1 Tax=Acer negundo TaxID=4023 RepID=A0AAD5NIU4_ACENE|nr:hypothetical protein LWI28_007318 [Acer negundo]KAK4836872.1 hypothetical protein QYF36_000947 [Acer negundo]